MKKALEEIVGADHFFDDPEILENYSEDRSLCRPGRPTCVVKPESTEEIQAIVRLANRTLIPLTPVSSGVHFNGAAIPHQGGIILDLRRMDRILNVDRRNRAVRIEPGVTWGRLQKELKAHDLMPLPPLVPHALQSALTSSLERQPMLIPKTEYGAPILTMEAVLPNGEIFRTGSASVGPPGKTQTDLMGPSGPGLDWFRLFQGAQGTFCIVTWMNMKAPPLPKREKVFFIPFQKIEKAVEPLYTLLRRMLGAECLLLNRFNLACILAKKGLDDFKALKKALPPFTLVLNLSGGNILPKEKIAFQEADLREIARQMKIKLETKLTAEAGKKGAAALLNLLRSPWKQQLYWKERFKQRCCDIFFFTTLNRVPYFTQLVNETAAGRAYDIKEIGLYIQPLEGGRACCLEFNFPWDIEDKEKICELYLHLSRRLASKGAFFGRPYGPWAELVYNRNIALTATLRNLKKILDPNQIMNPGKLCF